MSLNRRKKAIKFRGHHTHGYGSKKKHRGSGHQGGVGMAGTGKKADQKKTKIWKDKKYFGRHGFHSITREDIKAINIFYIETHLDSLVKSGVAKKEGSKYVINLKDLKINKLLGSGNPTNAYEITVDYASAAAVEKIAAAKGTVTVKNKSE
ncbi:MAG TPA: uL15 family ribosomal protein [Alphaproteobacteria bacterium]|nr:uL15 family ribosomal protein [Alphaproteobacteria bacterium]